MRCWLIRRVLAQGQGVGLQRGPFGPGADVGRSAEAGCVQEPNAHLQRGGALGCGGGEAGDVLDEAVELEAGRSVVAGEEADFFGLGEGFEGGAVEGFDLGGGSGGVFEQELGDGVGGEVGEDEEPLFGVGVEAVEAGLPGDEDGARGEGVWAGAWPGVGDAEGAEPAEQACGLLLVAGEVLGEGEALLIDVTGGLMQRQRQALHEAGEGAGQGVIVCGFAAVILGELQEESGGVGLAEDGEVEGGDLPGKAVEAGGDEDVAVAQAVEIRGEGVRGGFVVHIVHDEEPVVMGGEPVEDGGDAGGLLRGECAGVLEGEDFAESGQAGVEPLGGVATDKEERGVVVPVAVGVLDCGMRFPQTAEAFDAGGDALPLLLGDGGGVRGFFQGGVQFLEEVLPAQKELADVAAGEIGGMV